MIAWLGGLLCIAAMLAALPSIRFSSPASWLRYQVHLRRDLDAAGRSPSAADKFVQRQIFGGALSLLVGLLLILTGLPPEGAVAFASLGFLAPWLLLRRTVARRKREILHYFPHYLDLVSLALEAGLGLVAALDEIVRQDQHHPLREEFALTLRSIRLGIPRAEAFQAMAKRTGLDPLFLLAATIQQCDELGASLKGLLRLQAETVRAESFRQAEERAQRTPLKLLFPLLALIFPVLFVLIFAPLGIRLISSP